MLALASGTVVICGLAMAPMLSVLGLSTYASAVGVFYAMLPGIFLRMLADVPSYALYAARSDSSLLICNLGSALVSTLLNVLLVPVYGIYGAAVTSGIASGVLLLSLAVLANRRMRETRKKAAAPGTVGLPTDLEVL
jgi:O-antigen/teichoic acid export membrane protein